MDERTTQRVREREPDPARDRTFETDVGAATDRERTVRDRAGALFSPSRALVALAVSVAGLVTGSAVVPVAGGVVGVFLAAFLVGLFGERRPVTETALAGGVVLGASTLVDYLVWTLVGLGLPLVAIGVGVGLVVGGLGGYFGHDLRDGLTREL